MKEGWRKTTLGAEFTTVTGNTPSKNNLEFSGTFMPLVKPPELLDTIVSSAKDGLSKAGAEIARIAPPNSVLVSCIGNLGKVGLNSMPVAFNQQINAILPDMNRALPKFILYQMLSCDFKGRLEALSSGTTIPIVNKSKFNNIEIVLPALPEQQRIVELLDDALASLAIVQANAEKNLQNARALFENHLQSVFAHQGPDCEEKKLGDVCTITSMLIDPRKKEFLDLTHVGAGNIESQTGSFIELKTAREEGLISGKFLFDPSMVLYSKIRPYLMKVARPDFSGLCSADMYPLSPFPKEITRDFLYHLLLSKGFTDYAIQGSARAGMPKVNREHLFEFKFLLPDLKQQKRYAATLDKLHVQTQHLERIYQKKLTALGELKRSLLHQAFSGELTQDWRESKIIAFPKAIPNIKTTDLHAGILALAYQHHERYGKQAEFGHVKGEKIIHLVEALVGIDLGRAPVKDAAGPNDFPHLQKVEHRARMADYFRFQRVEGAAYRVTKLPKFDELITRTENALGERAAEVEKLLDTMRTMNTRQAEIFATVFAAWNNLLLDGNNPSDEAIVLEARENWHPDKLRIPREKFFAAITWMRDHDFAPKGRGKRVVEKVVKKK